MTDVGLALTEHGTRNTPEEHGRATPRAGGMKMRPAGIRDLNGYGSTESATTSEQMVICIPVDT